MIELSALAQGFVHIIPFLSPDSVKAGDRILIRLNLFKETAEYFRCAKSFRRRCYACWKRMLHNHRHPAQAQSQPTTVTQGHSVMVACRRIRKMICFSAGTLARAAVQENRDTWA